MAKRLPFTKKQFSDWVHAKPHRRYKRGDGPCPLERFITETLPKEKTESTAGYGPTSVSAYSIRIGDTNYNPPKWVTKFVHAVDDAGWNKAAKFI